MFTKILIANRGEIACRIIRTAKQMGIATVAVYSNADRSAQHVQLADEAIALGGLTAAESYLISSKIIQACKETGADAVHPGYGFLSEQATFVHQLEAENITFIGPPADAIASMGDKIKSKKLAKAHDVSTVPGHIGVIANTDEALKIASEIGYPVMIKASAGGGGKGMRIAHSSAEVADGYATAKREAAASFGDDRVFIEKFITTPRHIEIQVLGDKAGNIIHLNERECSIQRRNQKIIEEAPSPFLNDATRAAMGAEAVQLAAAVGYYSAGTVEFIVDADSNFYFLEMNTRLQVEHPVTELITGLDLVEEMIRIAAGESLRHQQDKIKINGWAMESRLYAEDPYRNFLPAIGRLSLYRPPKETMHDDGTLTRNDTGVKEGDTISIYYDPMIAKLCSWGPSRASAIERMQVALDAFTLRGIGHNIPFLSAVMEHPRFISGKISTAFIEEEYQTGFNGVKPDTTRQQHLGMIIAAAHEVETARLQSFKHIQIDILDKKLSTDYETKVVQFNTMVDQRTPPGSSIEDDIQIKVNLINKKNQSYEFTLETINMGKISLQLDLAPDHPKVHAKLVEDGKADTYIAELWRHQDCWHIYYRGCNLSAHVRSAHAAALAHYMKPVTRPNFSNMLLCPMPGSLVKILVREGDIVEPGQTLCIVEAMKMENALTSEKRCRVQSLQVNEGDILGVDSTIMIFEPID